MASEYSAELKNCTYTVLEQLVPGGGIA